MNKVVVIVSGGLDSTTLLYWVKNQGMDPTMLSFNYGQRHIKEINYAKKTSAKFKLEHKIIELPKNLLQGSALTSDIEVPHEHYTHENQKITVVPNRNMIMLSIAAGYAESIKANKLFYGAHAGDHAIYWDCRPEFVDRINDVIKLNDIFPVTIEDPFIKMSKIQLVTEGLKLQVDFRDTWSCYDPQGDDSCGECGTCVERIEAFKLNKVIDPISYKAKIDWTDCKKIDYLS